MTTTQSNWCASKIIDGDFVFSDDNGALIFRVSNRDGVWRWRPAYQRNEWSGPFTTKELAMIAARMGIRNEN